MDYRIISLYDRLKPHYIEQLHKTNIKYPELTGKIVDTLHDQSIVTELKYSSILDFKFLLGVDNPFEMFKDLLYDLYRKLHKLPRDED